MNNADIIRKLEKLLEWLHPGHLSCIDQYSDEVDDIKSDLLLAINAEPTNTKIVLPFYANKDEAHYANAHVKLIFDYYLVLFDFENAKVEEVESLTKCCGRLIDQIFHKAVPHKNLTPHHIYTNGFSELYHTIHFNRDYTNLSAFSYHQKGDAYSCLLRILIKHGYLDLAARIYQTYSFFISPKFLILKTKEFYNDEEKLKNINKKFADLLIRELEKLDISMYKYLTDKEPSEHSLVLDTQNGYDTFLNFRCQFENLFEKIYSPELKFKTSNMLKCLYPKGVGISEAMDFFIKRLAKRPNCGTESPTKEQLFQEDAARIKALYCNYISKNENLSLLLFSHSTQSTIISKDAEYFLSLMISGSILMLLESEIGKDAYLRLHCTKYDEKWKKGRFSEKLHAAFLNQNDCMKSFLADLMDLYINVKNYNSDYINPNEMIDFIELLEKRHTELEELEVSAKVNALSRDAFKFTPESVRNNCLTFFKNNRDGMFAMSESDAERLFAKLNNMEEIKKIISTGEIIFAPYREINGDVLSGDFTGLVACQIKAVERYLKEIIIRHARSKHQNLLVGNKALELTSDRYSSDKSLRVVQVDNNSTAANLSSRGPNCAFADIGACIAFVRNYGLSNKGKYNSFEYVEECGSRSFYKNWVDQVRNRHMHVIPIESLQEAKDKLRKTAYWLLKIIDELS